MFAEIEPAATVAPTYVHGDGTEESHPDWDSNNYFTNDCQSFTSDDARNMADALQRALPDICGR